MTVLFLICATVGGTVLLCQLVMALLGLAGDSMDGDVGHGLGGDMHGGGDFHGGDVHGGDMHGDTGGDLHDGDAGHAHAEHGLAQHGAAWLFRALSLRTITAGITFFGIGGMAAQEADGSTPVVLVVAAVCGGAAFYGVYWIMQTLYRLQAEGTVRINRAIGEHGTVYLRVPGHESGTGKVQINLQNRTMEYLAMTGGEEIPTGAKVVVTDVLSPDTVAVEAATEPERIDHA
jgi:hypothetical protein